MNRRILSSEREIWKVENALALRENFANLLLHPFTLIFFFCFAMFILALLSA